MKQNMSGRGLRRAVCGAVALASVFAGCGDAGDLGGDVGSGSQPLLLSGGKWPNGVVPTCWSAASQARSDFATRSGQIRAILNSTWPAVANIEFTGWGPCPSDTRGMAVINLSDTVGSVADVGYRSDRERTVTLRVTSSSFTTSLIPHEFGHTLGFSHEMRRTDFIDDPSGGCQESNVSGDFLGTPPDRLSIMASTGYCQSNPLLSRWDIVGARNAYGTRADNVVAAPGGYLYARKLSTGDIYRDTSTGWSRIGGPGGEFVAIGSALYGLAPDGSYVAQYSGSGTSWSAIGQAAARLFRCGPYLCATSPTTGDVARRVGTTWTWIGGPGAQFASTSTALYRLSPARDAVFRYSDSSNTWTQVGGPASAIYATNDAIFAMDPTGATLRKYNGTAWAAVGGPGRTFAAVGTTLYGLAPDRSSVWRYSGSGSTWTQVGGPAAWIYGGGSFLYATSPTGNVINRYTGSGTSWVTEGQP